MEAKSSADEQISLTNIITNFIQNNTNFATQNAILTDNISSNNTSNATVNNNDENNNFNQLDVNFPNYNRFDRLLVRLERNFHYLQIATRDRNATGLDLNELNNALIAGWERLALLRNQLNTGTDTTNTTTATNSTATTTTSTTTATMPTPISATNSAVNVGPLRNELQLSTLPLENFLRLQPMPVLPEPQVEFQEGNMRELNDENAELMDTDPLVLVERVPHVMPVLVNPRQINSILSESDSANTNINSSINANTTLALEDQDDFEYDDSDSEDLINEETEDEEEDDSNQGLISLSDLHILELEGTFKVLFGPRFGCSQMTN